MPSTAGTLSTARILPSYTFTSWLRIGNPAAVSANTMITALSKMLCPRLTVLGMYWFMWNQAPEAIASNPPSTAAPVMRPVSLNAMATPLSVA